MHGFPTSSFDFHHVVDALAEHRRVLLFDMIGYGLSAKPDRAYTVDLQADVAQAFVADAGVSRLALLTHDLGDTVGGELLARQAEGRWPVEITRRVITNGSIYIEMAHLSTGQQLLLSLPDERLPDTAGIDGAALQASLAATFSAALPCRGRPTWTGSGSSSPTTTGISCCRGPSATSRSGAATRPASPEPSRRTPRRWRSCGVPTTPSPWRAMATRLHDARPDATLTGSTTSGTTR